MKVLYLTPIIAMMPQEYYPQGILANPYIDMVLFLLAAACIAMFLIRMARPNTRPQRFFSPDFALAITPIFCAAASLVLNIFRLLDVARRVEITNSFLEHRIGSALRPAYGAAITSVLALLILFAVTVITRNERCGDR